MRKIIVTTVALTVLSSGLPAFAGPQRNSTINAELTLKQAGPHVEIEVSAEGLTPVVEPQVWLRRDPFGPMERQPMVPFGAARRPDETGGVDHRVIFPSPSHR